MPDLISARRHAHQWTSWDLRERPYWASNCRLCRCSLGTRPRLRGCLRCPLRRLLALQLVDVRVVALLPLRLRRTPTCLSQAMRMSSLTTLR